MLNIKKTSGVLSISQFKVVYHGKVIELGIEHVELPNGERCELELIRHPGGAVAIAINANRQVCLLRQYRHATGGWLWELPGGRIEAGEAPLLSAQRELREEAGIEADDWQPVIETWTTPGFCNEKLYLFLATGLTQHDPHTEVDEVLEVHWIDLAQAMTMCASGEIVDAKTLIGLYRLQHDASEQPG